MAKTKTRTSSVRKIYANPPAKIAVLLIMAADFVILGYFIALGYACSRTDVHCGNPSDTQLIKDATFQRCITFLWIFRFCL